MRDFKQALNHGLLLKKCTVIKFNQETWLTPYIDMNIELQKNAKKMISKKIFSS